MSDEPIVWRYTPRQPGDFLPGLPRRDLTARDLDRARARVAPAVLRDATVRAADGRALYTPIDGFPDETPAGETPAPDETTVGSKRRRDRLAESTETTKDNEA